MLYVIVRQLYLISGISKMNKIIAALLFILPTSVFAETNSLFNGYYVGGGLGYSHGKVAEGNTDWLENGTTPYLTSGSNSNFNHMLININAGYNLQLDNKSIIGFEIDNSTVNQTANGEALNYDISFNVVSDRLISKTKIDNIQTLRLKYGLELKDVYFYVTGGLALTKVKREVTGVNDGMGWAFFDFGESQKKTSFETGYAIGAGMEMPIKDNLTFNLKYIYTDFGDIKYTYQGHAFGHVNDGNQKIRLDNSMLTIGLNYHF